MEGMPVVPDESEVGSVLQRLLCRPAPVAAGLPGHGLAGMIVALLVCVERTSWRALLDWLAPTASALCPPGAACARPGSAMAPCIRRAGPPRERRAGPVRRIAGTPLAAGPLLWRHRRPEWWQHAGVSQEESLCGSDGRLAGSQDAGASGWQGARRVVWSQWARRSSAISWEGLPPGLWVSPAQSPALGPIASGPRRAPVHRCRRPPAATLCYARCQGSRAENARPGWLRPLRRMRNIWAPLCRRRAGARSVFLAPAAQGALLALPGDETGRRTGWRTALP